MAPRKFKFSSGKPASRKSSGTSGSSRRIASNPILSRKAATRKERPMKAIFKGKVMSIAGSIMTTSKNDPQPITYESISRWITAHGGTYEKKVGPETTHLICSIEEYKKRTEQVRKAWDLGKKQCKIVVFDWLEDCLLGPKLRKSLKSEEPYTLDRTIARIKKGFTDHVAYRKKFEEGTRASKALVDNTLNHVYCDPFDNFEYKVTLTRVNIDGKVHLEKYTCYLFESNAGPPHHFMTGCILSRSHRQTTYYREHCHPLPFVEAFFYFKDFFRKKTGVEWDNRLEGIKMPEDYFVYTPPILGRPVGFVCDGYVRPELRVRESIEGDSSEEVQSGEGESGSEREAEVVYDTDSEVDDEDSEDGGTTALTTTTGSRDESEGKSVISISNESRDESEVEELGGGSGGSFGASFASSNGGRSGVRGSSSRSDESGETERTPITTQGSQWSDGVGCGFDDTERARTPEGLIYLSD